MTEASPSMSEAAMLVFCFAPIDAPPRTRAAAHEYLRKRWAHCEELGMDQATALGVSVDFPSTPTLTSGGAFRVVAARRSLPDEGKVFLAYAFVEHDIVGLIAALAPNETPSRPDTWQALRKQWYGTSRPRDIPDGVLGEALVFQALVDPADPEQLERAARSVWPVPDRQIGWNAPYRTKDELILWEPAGAMVVEVQRELCVLAAPAQRRALDRLTWTGRPLRLPPLFRYLLHAGKLGYQQRVREHAGPIAPIRAETERAVDRLLKLHQEAISTQIGADELRAAQAQLHNVQARATGLLVVSTQLRELHRTVTIARANLKRHTPAGKAVGRDWSLFERDQQLADDLAEQVDNDLIYLSALRERVQEVQALTSSRVGALVEQRQDRLVLLQTSFLGALVTGLAAVEALQVKVPLHGEGQWLLIVLLALLASAVPGVVLRHDLPPARQPFYRRPLPVALTLAAGVGGALAAALAWRLAWQHPLPWGFGVAAGLVGAGAAAGAFRWRERKPPPT
jgi:hypothetical protein